MNERQKDISIIEFIGLPGAGKSSLASEVIRELKESGYQCYNHEQVFKNSSISNKWLHALCYYLKNIQLATLLFLYTLRSSPFNWRNLKYNCSRLQHLLKMIVMLEKTLQKTKNSSVMVFDQGIVQCVWSITSLSGTANEKILKKCAALKKHIFPGIIVYVQIDPDTAAQRITARQSSCLFDHLGLAQAKETFSRQKGNYPIIISTLKKVICPAVLVFNGYSFHKNDLDNLSAQLKKILEDDRYQD